MLKPAPRRLSPFQIQAIKQSVSTQDVMAKYMMELVRMHDGFKSKLGEFEKFVKSHPGPKGDTGLRGPQGVPGRILSAQEILKLVQPLLKIPKDGKDGETPKRGLHYMTAKDVKDFTKIISAHVKSQIKMPKDGAPGVFDINDVIKKIKEGKHLGVGDLEGWEETKKAFQRQTGNGYLHGSGVTGLEAGSNITITPDGKGGYVISATGSSVPDQRIRNEIVNGSGNTFTLMYTPIPGTQEIFQRGQLIYPNIGYTISGAVITTTDTLSAGDIGAEYDILSVTSGLIRLSATGSVNNSNKAFTFTEEPDFIVSDHFLYRRGHGWTWNAATFTATMTVAPTESLWGENLNTATEIDTTSAVNGFNTAFVFPSKPTYLVIDGGLYEQNIGWTWNAVSLTATVTVAPSDDIWGIGGGINTQITASGLANNSNTIFGFATEPSYIVSDHGMYEVGLGWSWNIGTLQATMSVAPDDDIWGL